MICVTCLWSDLKQCEPDTPCSCEDYSGEEDVLPDWNTWEEFIEEWIEYVGDEDLLFF